MPIKSSGTKRALSAEKEAVAQEKAPRHNRIKKIQ
jgi:hypothetical protein